MSELEELLERVKKATGPGDKALRYIDCHMWVIAQGGDARMVVCDSSEQDFIWERGIDGLWIRSVVKFRSVPKYTASIDAALALVERVLPGWQYNIMDGYCELRHPTFPSKDVSAFGATTPLAIVAATLSALIAQEKK